MALANYTPALPAPAHPLTTAAPPRLAPLDDLLYSPEEHQAASAPRPNEPFAPPRRKLRKRSGPPYLPPQYGQYPPYAHAHYDNPRLADAQEAGGGYVHDPSGDYDAFAQRRQDAPRAPPAPAPDYAPRGYLDASNPYRPTGSPRRTVPSFPGGGQGFQTVPSAGQSLGGGQSFQTVPSAAHGLGGGQSFQTVPSAAQGLGGGQSFQTVPSAAHGLGGGQSFQTVPSAAQGLGGGQGFPAGGVPPQPAPSGFAVTQGAEGAGPSRPSGFTKVEGGGGGNTKTQLHAVLDYDDDEYDDVPGEGGVNVLHQQVTPLQGPILVRNGSVPVVPLFPYPTVNNGSYYQIPILWTALSLALGYELQGQVIRGVPCVKRNYQLYCPTAGNTYPLDKIETFIDENKALMKRMYGAFGSGGGAARTRRAPGVPDPHPATGDTYFGHVGEGHGARAPRQASRTPPPLTPSQGNSSNRVDACESKTEIVTPYWALNSARKLRAVVNTMHFEQAIHQEVCSKTTTSRCSSDCGCEQKYKWHRLLAYDPEEDCAGIFMDWFLFPSCCVCRCNP